MSLLQKSIALMLAGILAVSLYVPFSTPTGTTGYAWLCLMLLTCAYYTPARREWSGEAFALKVAQVRVGVPFHWLVYTWPAAYSGSLGPHAPDAAAALRSVPKGTSYLPGLRIRWVELTLSIVSVAALALIVQTVSGRLARRYGTFLNDRVRLCLAIVIGSSAATVTGLIMASENLSPWGQFLAILAGVPIPVFFASRVCNSYRAAALLSFASPACGWWIGRMWVFPHVSLNSEDVEVPLICFAILLLLTWGSLAAKMYMERRRTRGHA